MSLRGRRTPFSPRAKLSGQASKLERATIPGQAGHQRRPANAGPTKNSGRGLGDRKIFHKRGKAAEEEKRHSPQAERRFPQAQPLSLPSPHPLCLSAPAWLRQPGPDLVQIVLMGGRGVPLASTYTERKSRYHHGMEHQQSQRWGSCPA